MRIPSSFLGRAAALAAAVLLVACGGGPVLRPAGPSVGGPPTVTGALSPGRLTPVAWQQVPGWDDDSLIGAAAALR